MEFSDDAELQISSLALKKWKNKNILEGWTCPGS